MHFRERFTAYIQRDVEVRVLRKQDSRLMKVLNVILFFVPDFMTNFTTTIGETIYMPENELRREDVGVVPLLSHECQHVWDNKRWGLLYSIGYLFPQILALGAIGAVWGGLWWLLFLIFLLPWPAPFRMLIERRGYLVFLALDEQLSLSMSSDRKARMIDNVVRQFVGKNYYFMWPFERSITEWLTKKLESSYTEKTYLPVLETAKRFIELP